MQLIFSFDTEEYETPGVDNAVKVWADMLSKHGCRSAFCLVGEKARVLRERGRKDVLDALASHEIDYHSNYHSEHPVHAEYLDEMGWDSGVERVRQEEASGVHDVESITGERPFAYYKPGSSWAPQVACAMDLLGLPVFCDAPFEFAPGPYLKAIAHILELTASQQSLPPRLSLDPDWATPAFACRKDLAEMQFTWSMFHPGFEGKNVIQLAQLQAWTAKPALKT